MPSQLHHKTLCVRSILLYGVLYGFFPLLCKCNSLENMFAANMIVAKKWRKKVAANQSWTLYAYICICIWIPPRAITYMIHACHHVLYKYTYILCDLFVSNMFFIVVVVGALCFSLSLEVKWLLYCVIHSLMHFDSYSTRRAASLLRWQTCATNINTAALYIKALKYVCNRRRHTRVTVIPDAIQSIYMAPD